MLEISLGCYPQCQLFYIIKENIKVVCQFMAFLWLTTLLFCVRACLIKLWVCHLSFVYQARSVWKDLDHSCKLTCNRCLGCAMIMFAVQKMLNYSKLVIILIYKYFVSARDLINFWGFILFSVLLAFHVFVLYFYRVMFFVYELFL